MVQLPQKISKLVDPNQSTMMSNQMFFTKNETIEASKVQQTTDYGHKRVLIVDDNKLNIKVATRALSDFDFEIEECYDGLQCLEKVNQNNNYDLILMDIMMPNMSGESALAKLKEKTDFNIPVIALTADAVAGYDQPAGRRDRSPGEGWGGGDGRRSLPARERHSKRYV